MRILITGGAGFIGSNLADKLLLREDEVFIIDDLSTGRLDNLNHNAVFFEGSIEDVDFCKLCFEKAKPEIVIHAAASYKDTTNWQKDASVNVGGTINILKAATQQKIKRIIYLQTALCYGHKPVEQPITLTHFINPDNSYAITKTAAEQFIAMSGLDYISFRLANVYGPRNLSGPFPTFYHKLTNQQKCYVSDARRDFVFIDDLVKILLMAIDGRGEAGKYHISSGTDFSIQEIFDLMCQKLDIKCGTDGSGMMFGRFWDDVKTILLEPSLTKKVFGYIPDTKLEYGITKAIEWYKTHEIVETYTHLSSEELKVRKVS